MSSIDDLVPISALQHFLFCPRRAALIYVERLWQDNAFTAEGTIAHKRAHDRSANESRGNKRIIRGLEVYSQKWGLSGKCDVVEFTYSATGELEAFDVIEYKRGTRRGKRDLPFYVQVCAQVLCLEEMLNVPANHAYLYYARAKHRAEIELSADLRQTTAVAIRELRELIRNRRTPAIGYQKRKCDRCSLISLCLPTAIRPRSTPGRYLNTLIHDAKAIESADNL